MLLSCKSGDEQNLCIPYLFLHIKRLATKPSHNIEIVFELQALCCLSYVSSTPPPVVSEAERHPGQAVKVSLLFIVAETAAILIFYYKGLNLLSPRCGCFILSFLALNCILLTKRVKGIANQPNEPC